MNQNKKYIKLLSVLPAVIIMIIIFLFSAKPAIESAATSDPIAETALKIWQFCFGTIQDQDYNSSLLTASFLVRKAAHITEYMVLAISISFALYMHGQKGVKLCTTTIISSVFYAATDEIHQHFVPGRGPNIRDVGIDTLGAVIGAVLFLGFLVLRERKKHPVIHQIN